MKKTLDSLANIVENFCSEREWDQFHGPKDLAIGIVTEASELLEHFRFFDEKRVASLMSDPEKREAISDELADILFFLLRFSKMQNIDLALALENKLNKNAEKYPVDKAKGRCEKYTEL